MSDRVQKILSQYGIASRRQAEQMILDGRVKVNGKIVTLGQTMDITQDQLLVDGRWIKSRSRPTPLYFLIHKPKGVIATCSDPENRRTVLDLLPERLRQGQGLHPVGRLDIDSTGALLLTNDGELTVHLTHPRYHLPKTYHVWVKGHPNESCLDQWRNGVYLAGQKTLPATVKVLQRQGDETLLEIVLVEGKNRQIRRVAESLGLLVNSLHRIAIGDLYLGNLPRGQYRELTKAERTSLQKWVHSSTTVPSSIQEYAV